MYLLSDYLALVLVSYFSCKKEISSLMSPITAMALLSIILTLSIPIIVDLLKLILCSAN